MHVYSTQTKTHTHKKSLIRYHPQLSPVVHLMLAGAIKQTQNNSKRILLKCLAKWNQNSHSSQFHKYIN